MELTGETKDWGRGMAEAFSMVKDQAPLVHMIANYVTASFCADAMAAMGARPLMAQAPEEMEEITGSADGLAVNLGQPSEEKYLACERALQTAGNLGLPAVLDPVGAGASGYRKKASASLCAASWPGRAWSGVLKGNSSEIHTVLTGAAAHSGVDSVGTFSHLEEEAAFLRDMREKGRKMVILETGAVDKLCWISESGGKDRIFRAAFGHEKSRRVNLVGTGCVTGAVLGALLAAEHKKTGAMPGTDRMALLAASAVSMVSFCCEAIGDGGYGTHKWKLLDALSQPDLDLYEAYIGRNMKWIC